MTALCGGGSSGPRPGVDATIALQGSAIDAAVSAAGFPELAPLIAVIASGTVLATDVYCTGDPPDDPGLTLQDITDAADPGNPIVFIPAAGKVKDAFLHWYWFQVCQCNSGATPTSPPLSFPNGYGTNPGLPGGQTGQANCWQQSQERSANYANGLAWNFNDTLPGALGVHTDGEFRSRLIPMPLPTSLQLTITNHGGGDGPVTVEPLVNWYNASGTSISGTYSGPGIAPGDPTFVHNIAIPPAAVEFQIICISLSGDDGTSTDVELTSTLFCGGSTPTSVSSSCCPPDPMVDTYLRNIYAIVNNIFLALPQIPPPVTSWDENGTHAGLTGVGTFGIGGGSVAVKFHFTSIPRQVGQSIEDPDFYFDLGFVSFTTLEGTYASMRIERADSVFTVPPLGWTVNYDIRYGAVATAIELIPHVDVVAP